MEPSEQPPKGEQKSSLRLLQLSKEQADFRPALGRFSRETRHPDIESVHHLAAQAQMTIYADNANTEMGKNLDRAETEFGARIPVTLLARGVVSPRYEAGNLNAWLGKKGIEANTIPERSQDYDWNRSHLQLGKITPEETLALVNSKQMTPGAVLETYDYLKTTLAEMKTRINSETDQKVLVAAETACFVLAEEIRACARGEVLPTEFYWAALELPMAGIGIELTKKIK